MCDTFIEIKADPWASTYCKLVAGHDGPCSPHYPEEAPMTDNEAVEGEVVDSPTAIGADDLRNVATVLFSAETGTPVTVSSEAVQKSCRSIGEMLQRLVPMVEALEAGDTTRAIQLLAEEGNPFLG